jgi:ubiquitin C-terminal hydrolase
MILGELETFVVQYAQKKEHERFLQDLDEMSEMQFDENDLTIYDCIDYMLTEERLGGDNKIRCDGCKEDHNMILRNSIWSLPPVLVVHLKRFEMNAYGQWMRFNKRVKFPLENFDLTRFSKDTVTFPPGECLRSGQDVEIFGLESEEGKKLNGLRGRAMFLHPVSKRFCVRVDEDDPHDKWKRILPKNLTPVPLSEKPALKPHIYDMVSVAKHIGHSFYGHYVSYARSSEDGLWRLYDDDVVTEVTPEKVESEHVGAYVLVYLRREFRPPAWGPPKPS